MAVKLSVIIPVYNVERYLEQCLQSVYEQSLSTDEFEVIVINDGTEDNSVEIVRRYAEQHCNIHFINQINQGLSATRNNGIRYAKGNYILCLDSDDFLLPETLSALLEKAISNDLEVLRADYQNCEENGTLLPKPADNVQRRPYYDQIVDGNTLYEKIYCKEFFSPLMLMKRTFLLKHDLFFEEGRYFEDVEFAFRLSRVARRVMYLPSVFYVYRLRNNSITHTVSEKKILDMRDIILKLKSYPNISSSTRFVMEENITSLFVFMLFRIAEGGVSMRSNVLQKVSAMNLKLRVSGMLKEVIVSFLFNILGIKIIPLLSVLLKIKTYKTVL